MYVTDFSRYTTEGGLLRSWETALKLTFAYSEQRKDRSLSPQLSTIVVAFLVARYSLGSGQYLGNSVCR